jgi:adenylate cyclase class 2
MHTEIEAKFLNIDHNIIREKLKEAGAICLHKERQMKRRNFDFPSGSLEKIAGWVRVRDEANKITMTYKQLNDRTLHGTKEVNLEIDDFEAACDFLKSIGLVETSYQETLRETWTLDGAEIELDTWPWIKPFIEIEASKEQQLEKVAAVLDLDMADAVHGSVEIAYQAEYDVSEAEIDHTEITFGSVPEWLEKRRLK